MREGEGRPVNRPWRLATTAKSGADSELGMPALSDRCTWWLGTLPQPVGLPNSHTFADRVGAAASAAATDCRGTRNLLQH